METKFQTSFIPKKPIVPTNVSGGNKPTISIILTLGVLVFLASILLAGGSYLYKRTLITSQDKYKKELAKKEKQFNIDLIEKLKKANTRIDTATRILDNHLAVSQIFNIISQFTIEKVRFMSMDVTTPVNASEGVKIDMRGYGTNLSSVAFQSDVFAKLEKYGLRKIVKNPIMSEPNFDAGGTVSFGFSAIIDPDSISYTKSVSGDTETDISTSTDSNN